MKKISLQNFIIQGGIIMSKIDVLILKLYKAQKNKNKELIKEYKKQLSKLLGV